MLILQFDGKLGSPAIYVIQTIEESRNYPLTGFGSKLVGE